MKTIPQKYKSNMKIR